MSILTFFGLISVSTMLIAYALEDRSREFVLLFAGACAASSAYGFLAGTWPFGIVEAIWTAVALRRWAGRKATRTETEVARPIACDMTALTAAERRRYDTLRPQVLNALDHVQETPTGFRLRIGRPASIADVAEWMEADTLQLARISPRSPSSTTTRGPARSMGDAIAFPTGKTGTGHDNRWSTKDPSGFRQCRTGLDRTR